MLDVIIVPHTRNCQIRRRKMRGNGEEEKERKREGDGFRGVEERGY